MSINQWLLVEWVDECNSFPSYGVVRTDSLVNEENDLHPGKMTYVRTKHGNSAKRAQILRISDDKRQVKEHKLLLERQNHQVQNMLSLCMRTIKEMKTDPLLYGSLNSNQRALLGEGGSSVVKPDPISTDTSDSDEEITNNTQNLQVTKGPVKTPAQLKRMIDSYNNKGLTESPAINIHAHQKRSTVMCNTPILIKVNGKSSPKLTIDQAMQTDDLPPSVPIEKLDEMETVLTQLHTQFLNLVQRLQLNRQEFGIYHSDEEQNRTVASDREQNEHINDETNGRHHLNNSNFESKDQIKEHNSKSLHVRRVSAHTTNTEQDSYLRDDMVPIGSGNAVVPARLLNELNWNSYSSVTRRLLQAIFPRKVLATHSLTGKQSPAFANKPAKKCLDPKLIDDVVDTVSERCGVSKRAVRTCITIKCTDEAKLYRNRMQGRTSGRSPKVPAAVENQENTPLSPIASRESSNGSG